MHGMRQRIHVLYGVIVAVMEQITHSMLYVEKKKKQSMKIFLIYP